LFPWGLTFGSDQNLYVSSFGTNSVLKYDGTTGGSLGTFASTNLSEPTFLTFTPERAVVPEPSSLVLLALGGLAIGGGGWLRRLSPGRGGAR
jgi:hypothetical protein